MTTELIEITNNEPQFEELPALPEVEATTEASTNAPAENIVVINNNLIYGGAGLIILILAAISVFIIVKKFRKKSSDNIKIDETNPYKSLATSDTIQKCIRVFLENTRIK